MRLLAGIDDALKEEIGFFQLIPEERVVLRELELAHVVFRDGFRTEDIKSGEEPASSRGLLVGDSLAVDLIGEIGIVVVEALTIHRQLIDVVRADRITDRLIRRGTLVGFLDLFQHLGRDATIRLLPIGGQRDTRREGHKK